jgi:HEAT repeat protein
MDPAPRKVLEGFIRRFGIALVRDPGRCEGLLRDSCPDNPREVFILVHTLREKVPADLLAIQGRLSPNMIFPHLERRLRDRCAFEEEAARWGVASWAMALGLIPLDDTTPGPHAEAVQKIRPGPVQLAPTRITNAEEMSAQLENLDLRERLETLHMLKNPFDRGETAILIRALANRFWQVRLTAFEALIERGEPAEDQLAAAVEEGEEEIAWRAALALGAMQSRPALSCLKKTALGKDRAVPLRKASVWALGEIRDPQAADTLLALLRDTEDTAEFRNDIEEALEKVGRQP